MRAPKPIPADVADLLHFDAETGVLRWRIQPSMRTAAGTVAGTFNPANGYIHISIRSKDYRAHRIAWAIAYGDPGDNEIDHINGDRSDNRLINLRLATQAQNSRNRKRHRNNTSGVSGVAWSRKLNKWTAKIQVGGKQTHLGCFDALEDAAVARIAAEKDNYKEFAAHKRPSAAA